VKVVHEKDLPVQSLVGRKSVVLLGEGSGSELLTHSVAYFDVGHAPGHTHTSDEVFFVHQGSGEVWLDGIPFALRPGAVVHTPGHIEHSVHTVSEEPIRLVAFACPHMVPGSYSDMAPRSRDLAEVPVATSPLVTYAPEDPSTRRVIGLSVKTDRINVAVRWLAAGQTDEIAALGRDVAINVLDGTGEVTHLGQSTPVLPGTAILLTGAESVVVGATTDLRLIEGRTTGWQPTSDDRAAS
jgi:quercetin dioxygenase-like cupin family protein